MSPPIIHFAGNFSPDQIHAHAVDSSPHLPLAACAAIESAWQEAKSRLGDRLFDGPMARLDSWRLDGPHLHLVFSPTGYKHFLGTNLTHPDFADHYGPQVLANPLGISALLETADGHLVMGRRGGGVAFHAHRIHPLGGTIEHITADCFTEIRRELEEEAGLTASDLIDLKCVGLAEDPAIRQPELMFHAVTNRPLAEIHLDAAEHEGIWSVRADQTAVARATQEPALTPIGVAALRLWYDAVRR